LKRPTPKGSRAEEGAVKTLLLPTPEAPGTVEEGAVWVEETRLERPSEELPSSSTEEEEEEAMAPGMAEEGAVKTLLLPTPEASGTVEERAAVTSRKPPTLGAVAPEEAAPVAT
jgi:hypothetical protein